MTELEKLKEAIEYFKVSEFWADHSSDDNAKHSSNIYKAAQKYLEIAPLLEEMIEALKKVKPNDSINNSVNNMTNFSRIAMDKTRQITEIMEGE